MDRQEKQKQYDEYITESSPMAAVIGRRVPYHLEYLRRYGDVMPAPTDNLATRMKKRVKSRKT